MVGVGRSQARHEVAFSEGDGEGVIGDAGRL